MRTFSPRQTGCHWPSLSSCLETVGRLYGALPSLAALLFIISLTHKMREDLDERDLGQGSGLLWSRHCKVQGFEVAFISEFNSDCSKILRGAETWFSRSFKKPSPPVPAHFLSIVCSHLTPAQPRVPIDRLTYLYSGL